MTTKRARYVEANGLVFACAAAGLSLGAPHADAAENEIDYLHKYICNSNI